MPSKTIAGISSIRIDGVRMPNRTPGKLIPNLPELEPYMGADNTLHGFKETPMPAEFEADFSLIAPLNPVSVALATSIEIQIEAPDKSVWVMVDARMVTRPELDFAEGQMTMKFVGRTVQQT